MNPPRPATLRKYGLTVEDWQSLYARAEGRCEICRVEATWFNIDHEHVKNWRRKKPEERKKYVRGLLCVGCNKNLVGRGVTPAKLRAAREYLLRHQESPFGN